MPGKGSMAEYILGKAREYVPNSVSVMRLADAAGNALIDICGAGWRSKTATSAAGAVTVAALAGKITTEALTTAALAAYTLTITNSMVDANDMVLVSIANGSNTAGIPIPARALAGAGSITIVIENQHATNAFNGTLVVTFVVLRTTPNV